MTDFLRPLTFGGLTLENNLLQAPLAGYSSAPFRLLTWRLGRPGLLATEMISSQALYMQAPQQERYLAKAAGEGPVAFQIWGRDPAAVEEASRIVTDRGADVVDLNCGCPVRKVRAAGAGSKLMEDPALIGRLVEAMRRGTARPVTVKIRVGTGGAHYNGAEVARVAQEAGADLVTVHGRHAKERYATPVRLERIAEVVAAVSLPVIGNGDVVDGASMRRMMEATGCAGVMVGRGCMGAPWVFERIRADLEGRAFTPPTRLEMGTILLEHHARLEGLIGPERAIRHTRKLGVFYSRGVSGAKEFRNQLNYCHARADLERLVDGYFRTGRGCSLSPGSNPETAPDASAIGRGGEAEGTA